MRRLVSVAVLMLLGGGLLAGCDEDPSLGCGSNTCHMSLSEGGSLTLDGQKLTVKRLDDNQVTFDSHGFDLTLSKATDISFAGYHLHFGGSSGSSVNIDVSK